MAQTEQQEPEPKGIGGWLLFMVVLLVFADARYLVALAAAASQAAALAHGQDVSGAIVRALEHSPVGYSFMFLNYCLLRIFQKRRDVPLIMTLFSGFNAAYAAGYWFSYANGYDWATRVPVHLYPLPMIIGLGVPLAWMGYFQSSVRVRNTFVTVDKPNTELKGIGGALLVPLAFLVLICAAMTGAMIAGDLVHKSIYAIQHSHTRALLWNATIVAFLGYSIYCLVCFLQKKRETPRLMLAQYGLVMISVAASNLWPRPHFNHEALVAGAISFLLAAYFLNSKRVKNTFTR